MEHLTEIIGYLPPYVRTIVVLMLVAQPMAAFALGLLRAFRGYDLPWGASSDRLQSVMLWLVCLPAIVLVLLAFYVVGATIWQELADAFPQTGH